MRIWALELTKMRGRNLVRKSLSGLLVTVFTIVAYLAFWNLAPRTTFVVGCVALFGMLIAAWHFGRASRSRGR